ncbi:MAG: DUF6512 family protein [Eubacteriales bacterium]|nr:DUF6512 family protein [Eubacteriales bacterium]
MNKKLFTILEFIGVPIIYLIASVLHFVYDWSGGSVLSILFGAVNESVWEHVKIFAVAFTLWTAIELLAVKPPFKKFVVAKTISLYFLSLSIIVFFYAYNLFTSKPILWLDLLSSFVFTLLSQTISYYLTTKENTITDYFPVAVMLIMLYFMMFFSFTVFPPKADLFKDPVTCMYGIIGKNIDEGAIFLDKT